MKVCSGRREVVSEILSVANDERWRAVDLEQPSSPWALI